jgi:hypothetical protein
MLLRVRVLLLLARLRMLKAAGEKPMTWIHLESEVADKNLFIIFMS